MLVVRRILFFLVLLLAGFALRAQQQDKAQSKVYMDMAIDIMAGSRAVDDARDLVVMAANYDTTNLKANFEAGYMHIETIHKELGAEFLMRVYRQSPYYRFDLEYQIGRSLHYGLKFDKAIEYYTRYKTRLSKTPDYKGKDKIDLKEVDRKIEECKNGKEFVANPGLFSITNLGTNINSEFDDYAPVVNADETEMYFTTRRRDGNLNENVGDDNRPFEDIFVSKKNGEKWETSNNIGIPVNTKFNDADIALSPSGKILFLYKDGVGGGDIFFSERQPDGKWSKPSPLPGAVNSSFYESSITITKDETTIFFASERPGGLGGLDIYYSVKDKKGLWTIAKNAGPSINTEYDEDAPFIDHDGKTLYFSSKGRKGMGGFDIFKATLLNLDKKEWSEPENVGYPINTPDDDVFITGTATPNRFYYSSVRADGSGYSDIYLISDAPKTPDTTKNVTARKGVQPLMLMLTVVDAETKEPLEVSVHMRGKDNSSVASATTGPGKYEFAIMSTASKEYLLSIELDGYIFENIKIPLGGASDQPTTVERTVAMRKLAIGATTAMRNIFFDIGKAKLKEESFEELNMLVTLMNHTQTLQVEIGGHTDSTGNDDFNKKLSQQRADAVRVYLISQGINGRRVKSVGYGEEQPLVSNDDEDEGREFNRRVEFKIIGK